LQKTGLRSDIVTLYHGGLYHLYHYKKYTDVRLVMAPEHGIASFGGDVDNFEYPRYCLDFSFFRVYQNDRPAKCEHYFKWSREGPAEGDLVFVTGHPGSTNRLDTLAKLKHRRDVTLPYVLNRLRYQEALLLQFSNRGPEQAKMAAKDLARVANARKAFSGQYQGLLNPAILERKANEEQALRKQVDRDATKRQAYGDAWNKIAEAERNLAEFERLYMLLERPDGRGDAFDSELFQIARTLVRLASEKLKPNAERLREYRDSNLESLEFQLFSPAPIHPELERVKLAGSLSFLAENLGGDHPYVVEILNGKAPGAHAAELIAGTKLAHPAERRKLAGEGRKGIAESKDAMIRFAQAIDGDARKLRKRYEDQVE